MIRTHRIPLLLAAALGVTPALAEGPPTEGSSTVSQERQAPKDTRERSREVARKKNGHEPVRDQDIGSQNASDADEERWRAAFRAAHARISKLDAEAQEARATLADPAAHGVRVVYNFRAGGTVVPSPELEKVKENLAHTESELEQARRDLDELERQASREAVPREWRR